MLTCVTRSMNDELYEMMLSLCPNHWRFVRVLNSTATGYLDYLFTAEFGTKWVLNLDEDCFLFDPNEVIKLLKFMESDNYDYCGVQDGGSISVRVHNPLTTNPFFNLFNSEKILPLEKNYYSKRYELGSITEKYQQHIRFKEKDYKFDFYEPFYSHFFWLLENGLTPYFLDAEDFSQEKYFVIAPLLRIIPYYNSPTLVRNHDGNAIALHTWHSRFMNYPNIRRRIMNCYKLALGTKDIQTNNFETVTLNR
jgi:hypothetical protein